MIPPKKSDHGAGVVHVMCPGENKRYHRLQISDGLVNRNTKFNEVCPVAELDSEPEYRYINIAYNNDPFWFTIYNNNTMKEYTIKRILEQSNDFLRISYTWEVLTVFFKNYNVIPTWIYCHQSWGKYDKNTGRWTGAVGEVRSNNLHTIYYL